MRPALELTLPGCSPARSFFVGTWQQEGFLSEDRPVRTLRELLSRLRETYCGSTGYEYMHIPDKAKRDWIQSKIETLEPVRAAIFEPLNFEHLPTVTLPTLALSLPRSPGNSLPRRRSRSSTAWPGQRALRGFSLKSTSQPRGLGSRAARLLSRG
jgi:hypothetical protein